MIKKAVVDFSAFLGRAGEPVIKELSIVDVDSMCAQHWLFKPPKEEVMTSPRNDRNWLHQNTWVGTYYHGVDYYAGYTEYNVLQRALDLCNDFQLLYAPTREKAIVLEGLLCPTRAVFSLEDLGCTKLPRVSMRLCPAEVEEEDEAEGCLYHLIHAPKFNCTLRNVRLLAAWCTGNLHMIDMNSVDNRERTFGDWPCAHPTARQLAEQGFVRVHSDKDSTKCVYCNVVLHRWMPQDDVEHDHEQNSPFCKFVKRKHQLATQLKDSMLNNPPATAIKEPLISERDLYDMCSS